MRQIAGGRHDTCGRLVGLRCDTCGRLGRLIVLIWVYMCEYVCICGYMCVNVCMCVCESVCELVICSQLSRCGGPGGPWIQYSNWPPYKSKCALIALMYVYMCVYV